MYYITVTIVAAAAVAAAARVELDSKLRSRPLVKRAREKDYLSSVYP